MKLERPIGTQPTTEQLTGFEAANTRARSGVSGYLSPSLFIALLSLAILLRFSPIATKQLLLPDEISSYLVVTGHLGELKTRSYERTLPVMEWVLVQEWQRFIEFEKDADLFVMATDLMTHDLHPPAYFILLSGWMGLAGDSYFSSMLLSFLIDLACFGLLVFSGRIIFSSRRFGWVAGLIWLVSPVAARGGVIIRQYSLLTMLSILFALLLSYFLFSCEARRQRWGATLGLLVISVAGLLTHVLFVFIIVAGLTAVLLFDRDRQYLRFMWPLVIMVVGMLMFIILLPEPFSARNFILRQLDLLHFDVNLLVPFAKYSSLLLLPLGIPLVLNLYLFIRNRIEKEPLSLVWNEENRSAFAFTLVMFLVPALLHSAFYLSGLFSQHSILYRHLLYLTPFVALLAAAWLQLLPINQASKVILAGLSICLILVSIFAPGIDKNPRPAFSAMSQLSEYDHFVVDNLQQPELFTYMGTDSSVFVATQDELLSQPDAWLPRLIAEGGVYVSYIPVFRKGPWAPGTAAGRDKMVALIEKSGDLRLVEQIRENQMQVSIYEVGE